MAGTEPWLIAHEISSFSPDGNSAAEAKQNQRLALRSAHPRDGESQVAVFGDGVRVHRLIRACWDLPLGWA